MESLSGVQNGSVYRLFQHGAGRCGSGERVSSMRAQQVHRGTDGDNTGRIDVIMREVVMPLDVIEIYRVRNAGHLIEVFEVTGQIRVVDDAPEVAFEMSMIDGVKPDEGDKESPIGFDELRAEEIAPLAESGVQLIQRREE